MTWTFYTLARMEKAGVKPAPDADRSTLLRRVTYDLTGLPPDTGGDYGLFCSDTSTDRVRPRRRSIAGIASLWRTMGTALAGRRALCGYLRQRVRLSGAAGIQYRNYVIQAFNGDVPFDRFVREQLAGDLLPFATEEERQRHIVATGYVASARHFRGRRWRTPSHDRGRHREYGTRFLGMSLSCARCHDHKFDPISSRDYYALYGIFSSTNLPPPWQRGKESSGEPRPSGAVRGSKASGTNPERRTRRNRGRDQSGGKNKATAEAEPDTPEKKAKVEAASKLEAEVRKKKKALAEKQLYPLAYAISEGTSSNARCRCAAIQSGSAKKCLVVSSRCWAHRRYPKTRSKVERWSWRVGSPIRRIRSPHECW
jgi:hypothetical protein